jgi:hypothetical protein
LLALREQISETARYYRNRKQWPTQLIPSTPVVTVTVSITPSEVTIVSAEVAVSAVVIPAPVVSSRSNIPVGSAFGVHWIPMTEPVATIRPAADVTPIVSIGDRCHRIPTAGDDLTAS